MNEDYAFYAPAQYLGRRGNTRPCMLAMAAILTSAFSPSKITVVSNTARGYNHESVLFLVWDWAFPNLTIIPDGFGTHGGGGGAGLSRVLGLIKFYRIPLFHLRVFDQDMFSELADGKLTEEMFEEAQEAPSYNWAFYPVATVQKVKKGTRQSLEITIEDGDLSLTIPLPRP